MSMIFARPSQHPADRSFRPDPVWFLAVIAMVGLSACSFLLNPEQSLALALGFLILLIALADLRAGFLAYIALYPFIPITWGVDVAEWMPYLTAKRLCCLSLAVAFVPQMKNALDAPQVKRVTGLILSLILVETVAGFVSRDPLGSVKITFDAVLEMYLPFLIGAHLFRTKAQVRTLFIVILVSMGIVAILALIEHATDYNFYESFIAVRDDVQNMLQHHTETHRGLDMHARRVRVAFDHPIELGLHLMCAFLMLIYFLSQRGLLRKIVLFTSLPVFALAMMYTYSRGPLLGLACGLVWLGLVGRGVRTLLPLILLCGAAGYLLMPSQSRDVLQETITSSTDLDTGDSIGGGSVRARLGLLQMGLQLSQQNVWFGLGPSEVSKHHMTTNGGGKVDFASVDNYYLQTLLWHGAVALAGTVGLYAYLLGFFTRSALRLADRELALLAALAASSCVASYIALATVAFNNTLFWILLGTALRLCDGHSRIRPRRKIPTAGPGTGGQRSMRREQETQEQSLPALGVRRWALGIDKGPARARATSTNTVKDERVLDLVASCSGAKRLRFITAALGVLCMGWLPPTPCDAAPGFYGTTGLYETPVAATAPRGVWSLGTTYVGRDYRPGASSISPGTVANAFTVTLLPRLELGIVLTNFEGKLGIRRRNKGLSPDYGIAGYTVDRSAVVQWLVLTQRGSRPAVALGARDMFGIQQLQQAQYGVTSLQRGRLTVSAGLGTRNLRGLFGGAEFAVTPRVTSIVEQLHGQWNGGFRLIPLRDVQLDAALMGFHSLGGGLSYRRRF